MAAYFCVESFSGWNGVTFRGLQTKLIGMANARIQNGEFTERGLARVVGISQPQMHNVLKGVRKLRLEIADRLLCSLGLSILDLLPEEGAGENTGSRSVTAGIPRMGAGRAMEIGRTLGAGDDHSVLKKRAQRVINSRMPQANRAN